MTCIGVRACVNVCMHVDMCSCVCVRVYSFAN